jgi:hypothetical protein
MRQHTGVAAVKMGYLDFLSPLLVFLGSFLSLPLFVGCSEEGTELLESSLGPDIVGGEYDLGGSPLPQMSESQACAPYTITRDHTFLK